MDIKKEFLTSIRVFVGFSIILGIAYPLLITGIAQLTMPKQANGSLITENNKIVGSKLIGQNFDKPEYFQGRPSAINYDSSTSGATNLGPTNKKLAETTRLRIEEVRRINNIARDKKIPADMVLASASGLDYQISEQNALLQVQRVSKERNIAESELKNLVKKHTQHDFIGLWGQKGVNVLELNLELDKKAGK